MRRHGHGLARNSTGLVGGQVHREAMNLGSGPIEGGESDHGGLEDARWTSGKHTPVNGDDLSLQTLKHTVLQIAFLPATASQHKW